MLRSQPWSPEVFPYNLWGVLATRSGKNGVANRGIAMEFMVDLEKGTDLEDVENKLQRIPPNSYTFILSNLYVFFFRKS